MRSSSSVIAMLTLAWPLLSSCDASAQQQISQEHTDFFESKIRPVLIQQCHECHSEESGKARGGLLLDSKDAVLSGGESGPALVTGKLDESLLWEAINYDSFQMPPSGQLPEDVIVALRRG